MGLKDYQLTFSRAQVITASTDSTYYLSVGTAGSDVGFGAKRIDVDIDILQSFNLLTSLDIALQTDDNTSFSSAVTLWTKNVVLAGLTKGAQIQLPSANIGPMEQYIRLYYTVNGSGPSTGIITAAATFGKGHYATPSDYRKTVL